MVIDTRLMRPQNFVGTGEQYNPLYDTGESPHGMGEDPNQFTDAIDNVLKIADELTGAYPKKIGNWLLSKDDGGYFYYNPNTKAMMPAKDLLDWMKKASKNKNSFAGMGMLSNLGVGLDPFSSAFTAILQPISSWLQAKEQSKTADKQIKLERDVLKEQKLENARTFAEQQALDFAAVSARKRQEQVISLWAVGGAAVLISALFVYGAVKSK